MSAAVAIEVYEGSDHPIRLYVAGADFEAAAAVELRVGFPHLRILSLTKAGGHLVPVAGQPEYVDVNVTAGDLLGMAGPYDYRVYYTAAGGGPRVVLHGKFLVHPYAAV